MHLVSHFSSGLCIGSFFMPFLGKKIPESSPFLAPVVIGIGATLPDIDGVSVFLNHGVFYGSQWYSHHGVLHSPVGSFFLCFLPTLIVGIYSLWRSRYELIRYCLLYSTLLLIGCMLHIVEDLPCPGEPWWGIMIFWPLSSQRYGGWSHIYWVNEYLMVVLSCGALISLALLAVMKKIPAKFHLLAASLMIGISTVTLAIALRFTWISKFENPIQWERYQKGIIGEPLFILAKFVNSLVQEIWAKELLR